METAHREHPKYFRIFWWLLALTIVEVAVVIPPLPTLLKGILLVGLACSKAAFVALYFMHLKFEKRALTVIALTPFIICVFLVFMLLPDLMAGARHTGTVASTSHAVDTSH